MILMMRQSVLAALTVAALAGGGAAVYFLLGLGGASEEGPSDPNDWCAEHGLPESRCTICNPELAADPNDWCAEHGVPESRCSICNPAPADGGNAPLPTVRFARPDTAARAGIATAAVETRTIADVVAAPGRLAFDESRRAHVASATAGVVREVRFDLGQDVKKGDILAVIASDAVAEARSALAGAAERAALAALRLERETELEAQRISRRDALLEAKEALVLAEAALRSARERVRVLGADPDATAPGDDPARLEVRSPLAGTVIARHAVLGERVSEASQLFEIVDLTRLALFADVAEADASRLAIGVRVEAGGPPPSLAPISGRVDWLAAEIDPRSRTVAARAMIENPGRALRANTFLRVRVLIEDAATGPAVRKSAVQRTDGGDVVFVRTGDRTFEPRRIEILADDGEWVRVRGGVAAGDLVATDGSFLLKTEIMKGSIGAGCCDEPAKASH